MPTLNWDRCLEYALLLIHSVANLCGFCVDVFLQPLRPHPRKQNGLAEDNYNIPFGRSDEASKILSCFRLSVC